MDRDVIVVDSMKASASPNFENYVKCVKANQHKASFSNFLNRLRSFSIMIPI